MATKKISRKGAGKAAPGKKAPTASGGVSTLPTATDAVAAQIKAAAGVTHPRSRTVRRAKRNMRVLPLGYGERRSG